MFGRKFRGLSEPPVDSSSGNVSAEAAMQAKLNRLSATYGLSGSQNDLNLNGNNGTLLLGDELPQQPQQQQGNNGLLSNSEQNGQMNGNANGHVRTARSDMYMIDRWKFRPKKNIQVLKVFKEIFIVMFIYFCYE